MSLSRSLVTVYTFAIMLTLPLCARATDGIPDPKVPAPAKVSPSGVLIITVPRSQAWIMPNSGILLSTLDCAPGFQAANVYLNLDGSGEELGAEGKAPPTVVFVPGVREGQRVIHPRRLAMVTMADESGRIVEVMRCMVDSRDPGVHLSVATSWKDERFKVAVEHRQALRGVFFYAEGGYLGRLPDSADVASIDCRRMAAGMHTLWAIAEAADGTLLPPAKLDALVAPRYTISCEGDKKEYTIPFESPNVNIGLKIARAPGVDCVKARVYIAGVKVGEFDKPEFSVTYPLKDVPSGSALVEVVGIAKDGMKYCPETLAVDISNSIWDSNTVGTVEYQTIKANRRQLDALEQEYQMWVGRLQNEPAFYADNIISDRTVLTSAGYITQSILQTFRRPGRSAEYLGNALRASVEMAQLMLTNGRLYKRLRMMGAARASFRQASMYSGVGGSTNRLAIGELDAMNDPL